MSETKCHVCGLRRQTSPASTVAKPSQAASGMTPRAAGRSIFQAVAASAAVPAAIVPAAAVLVPIIDRDELSVLFTQRTAHLADHAGQISFPGGKIDASDESPAAAALREAEERESRDWNGLSLSLYAMPLGNRNIWGATAGILRNLYELVYRG